MEIGSGEAGGWSVFEQNSGLVPKYCQFSPAGPCTTPVFAMKTPVMMHPVMPPIACVPKASGRGPFGAALHYYDWKRLRTSPPKRQHHLSRVDNGSTHGIVGPT